MVKSEPPGKGSQGFGQEHPVLSRIHSVNYIFTKKKDQIVAKHTIGVHVKNAILNSSDF